MGQWPRSQNIKVGKFLAEDYPKKKMPKAFKFLSNIHGWEPWSLQRTINHQKKIVSLTL